MSSDETITAIATFPYSSALGVIRVSGAGTGSMLKKVFRFRNESKDFPSIAGHTLHNGFVHDNNRDLDEVLLSVFKSPASYTGEDMAELSCHGGAYVMYRVLELLLSSGARLAEPGEFTKRAFLNGKLDLSQAEAVADVISAATPSALEIALNQLKGKEKLAITGLRREFLKILSLVEAEIDFAGEDIEKTSRADIISMLSGLSSMLEGLIRNADAGIMLKNGASVVIAGKPNAGKSSLLNAMLGKDRAIVTHIPGTTRDIIEDAVSVGGLLCRLFDTAGLHKTSDAVESEGIKRAKQAMASADVILFVMDMSSPVSADDSAIMRELSGKRFIPVLNKSDLAPAVDDSVLSSFLGDHFKRSVKVSALKKKGMDELADAVKGVLFPAELPDSIEITVSSLRHRESLKAALTAAASALNALRSGVPLEFPASDIKRAAGFVSSIIGDVTPDEVLGNIFKNFCIGK